MDIYNFIHCWMRLSSGELVVSNYRLMKDPNNKDIPDVESIVCSV